jgi:hypothetical protein
MKDLGNIFPTYGATALKLLYVEGTNSIKDLKRKYIGRDSTIKELRDI